MKAFALGFFLTVFVTLLSLNATAKALKKQLALKPLPTAAPSLTPIPTPVPHLSYSKDGPVSAKPFWKSKPELMKKMIDNREIIVSVRREDPRTGPSTFNMAGAGIVARDKEAAFKVAQDFSKLKEVSDHFQTVTYDPKEQKLFLVVEALGYQARMLMHLTPVSEDWRSEIQWEVIWGSFTGMKGVIGFERLGPRQTEVSITGHFEAKELPIPKIIMGFALEVITQKVAENMRHYIESHTL